MTEAFWTAKPINLISEVNFFPISGISLSRNLNRITRFIILLSIVLAAVYKSIKPLYFGLVLITVIAILYFLSHNQMNTEGFGNVSGSAGRAGVMTPQTAGTFGAYGPQLTQRSLLNSANNPTKVGPPYPSYAVSPYDAPIFAYGPGPQIYRLASDVINAPDPLSFFQEPNLRAPTVDNPFMNLRPLDYGAPPFFQDYNRYEKITYPTDKSLEIRQEVEDDFETGLFQDANGRLFNRFNSQRQYVSQPIGSVPNNQTEYAQWLYGNQYVCKSGSIYDRYGVEYTDDSLVCNGFNVSAPTNKGLLNKNLMSSVARDR